MKKYEVKNRFDPIEIDADWNKPVWQAVEATNVEIIHWPVQSEHMPKTQVKLQYDAENLYVIFRVEDKYVRAAVKQRHGPVYKDSCVEFFFSPSLKEPDSYFNFEINCCGVLLAEHHTGPRANSRYLNEADCERILIASSVSGPVENEVIKPFTWTVEYALPFAVLCQYGDFDKPAPGVTWHGNFYKCADETSHPHWLSWSKVSSKDPDFHRPDCFGRLEFESIE